MSQLTSTDLALFYGISIAFFFAAALYMWIFAISFHYSNRKDYIHTLDELINIFTLSGTAFALFGLFNVYVIQLHFPEIRNALPRLWFDLGKFSAPLSLICFTQMFTRSTPIKSLDAFAFWLKQEKYYKLLYIIDILFVIALFFLRDPHLITSLSIYLFVPHCLAGVLFAFKGLSSVKLSRFYGLLFLMIALGMLILGITLTITNIQAIPLPLLASMHIGFGIMVLQLSFVTTRLNQVESKRFTDMSKVKMDDFFKKIYMALNNEQFYLVYQPKVDSRSNQICGVEALIRWSHPKDGNIPPSDFIPAAEQTEIIDNICRWTIKQVATDASHLAKNKIDCPISINFSVRNLHPEIVHYLYECLKEQQVQTEAIMIEITESLYIDQSEQQKEALKLLRQLDIKLSLDDFGAGFSSLSHLDQIGISEIKIDKSFIINMKKSDKNLIIVNSTIKMGQALGISVVAEGVENEKTRERLIEMECEKIQGFAIAKPMPIDDLVNWIQTSS